MTNKKFSGKWVQVTPALAGKWLEGNVHNRPVRDHIVIQYATSMRLGLWRKSPEPIMFNGEGTLLNGQHRLWAVVESGETHQFYVMRGVDTEVLLVLDQGSARSAHDNMNLSNENLSQRITADDISVLRAMLTGPGRMRIPVEFCERLWKFYKNNVIQAKNAFGGRTSIPATVMVRAIVARASFTQSAGRLFEFCQVVLTGVAPSPKYVVAIKLRDLLIGEWRSSTMRPTKATIWGKIESSLVHFLSGTVPKNLIGFEKEQFKIPEPILLQRLRGMEIERFRKIGEKKKKLGIKPRRGSVINMERIFDILRDSGNPLSRQEVQEKMEIVLSRSNVQSMIANLVSAKRIERVGIGTATKYQYQP